MLTSLVLGIMVFIITGIHMLYFRRRRERGRTSKRGTSTRLQVGCPSPHCSYEATAVYKSQARLHTTTYKPRWIFLIISNCTSFYVTPSKHNWFFFTANTSRRHVSELLLHLQVVYCCVRYVTAVLSNFPWNNTRNVEIVIKSKNENYKIECFSL
jgi:hypothetical protein